MGLKLYNYLMKPDMSEDETAKFNEEQAKEVAVDYKEFKADLDKGICWVCKDRLDSFSEDKPCQHWLLMPNGFKKKRLKKIFEVKTYEKIEVFLRWYVNAHEPFRNINDLKEEHDPDVVKALTIKHGDIEWSFYFGTGCLEGKDGAHGPHYHFQMLVNDKIFHSYSNRHIKLSDFELWQLDIELGKNPKIMKAKLHDAGMQDVFDNAEPHELLKAMRSTDDYDNATFHISSLVMADEGHTISGDDFADLVEEHNRTGIPMHQLVKKLNNVKTRVIVEPGPGVPLPKQRKKHRGAKKNKDKD